MSPRLGLRFLYPPQVRMNDAPVLIDRRTVVALLAYLAVNDWELTGQRYSREFLSGLLWRDFDQSRTFTNLRHTWWEIHQNIGKDWIAVDRNSVGIHAGANVDLDVSRFRELITLSQQPLDLIQRVPLLIEAGATTS